MRRGNFAVEGCITIFTIVMIGAILTGIVSYVGKQTQEIANRRACLATITKLEAAKTGYEKEHKLTFGSVFPAQAFIYLPECPSGGTYNLGRAGHGVSCDRHLKIGKYVSPP